MADIVARGVRFNVVRMSERGTPVVFVHGLPLDNLSSFYMSVAPAVAKHASVILYDLRGHGMSEQPDSGYTGDDMVEDLVGILGALGLPDRRVIIVGHSFGGYVALRFAEKYPQRVAGLALLEAHSGVADIGERIGASIALDGEERDRKIKEVFGTWLASHAARAHVDVDEIDLDTLDADARATAEFAGRLSRQRRRPSPMVRTAQRLRDETTLARDLAATTPIVDATLSRIERPLLAIYGETSDLRPEGERLARLVPRSRLVIVPGCAHGILFQATPFVRDALIQWIGDVERGPH